MFGYKYAAMLTDFRHDRFDSVFFARHCFTESHCLYAFRQFAAFLCIGSLLFSNVAGWMHVGCVDKTAECCASSSTELADCQNQQATCCNHSHGEHRAYQHDGTTSHKSEDSNSLPVNDDCSHEHDSDRCSICQSFFSLRNGAVTSGLVITDFGDTAEIISCSPVRSCQRVLFDDSISVRGPPRV